MVALVGPVSYGIAIDVQYGTRHEAHLTDTDRADTLVNCDWLPHCEGGEGGSFKYCIMHASAAGRL